MQHKYSFFIVLYIYTLFSLRAQEPSVLSISKTSNAAYQTLLDSLHTETKHTNFKDALTYAQTLKKKLQELGYIDTTLKTQIIAKDTLQHTFFLGNFFENLELHVFDPALKRIIQKHTSQKEPNIYILKTAFAKALLEQITEASTQNGRPFTTYQFSDIKKIDSSRLQATLTSSNTRTRTIDSLIIKGYDKLPRSFIKYLAKIKKRQLLDLAEIASKTEKLNQLPFISITKPPEALFTKDSSSIYIYAKKQAANTLDGIIGFQTNETTENLELNGYLDLSLTNNLNYGETLRIYYKDDGNDQSQFRLQLELPFILKSPFSLAHELRISRQDSTFSTTTNKTEMLYNARPNLQIKAGIRNEVSSSLDNTTSNTEDYDAQSYSIGASYTKNQDRPLEPIKTTINLEAGTGKRTSSSEINQNRYNLTLQHILTLNKKNSLYISNHTAWLQSNNYIDNELFRIGGIGSIRGVNENSIAVNLHSTVRTEYRHYLNQGLYVNSVLDATYFENELLRQKERLYTIGLGASILTKGTIIRLNIANANTLNQNFRFSNTIIHLNFIARF